MKEEIIKDIQKVGDEQFELLIKDKYKLPHPDVNEHGNPVPNKEEDEKTKEKLLEIYRNIIDIIKTYIEINPIYYPIIATWIIGSYTHEHFKTYPFLFFNAMKGSGKTRMLNLIAFLSKEGEVQNNMTEAVLFRTKGTLCLDEFEGVTRRGNENLRELLNAAYKKGAKVKRMKKKRGLEGEEQVVEEFDMFRPICMANIFGMENVLADRCISVVLEKSSNQKITRLIEDFDQNKLILDTKSLLLELSVVICSFLSVGECTQEWNKYIHTNYTTTLTYNYTKLHLLFEKIKNSNLDGRNLELSMPLLIIANVIGNDVVDDLMSSLVKIIEDRKVDDIYNNKDVALIDFISQEIPKEEFLSITDLTRKFKEFIGEGDDWINPRFVGRSLERVKLISKKKRLSNGIYVILDYEKAQEKIKMFK